MQLYTIGKNDALTLIKESKPAKEKALQLLTEKNLFTVFGFEFVCTEFQVGSLRIDTLAYNPETRSFVIIEYKKSESSSVIDQGFAYLGLMLEKRAAFVLKLSEVKNKVTLEKDIDWSQSRVYFVSPNFNNYQLGTLSFSDLPIELWEVKTYQGQHISYRKLEYGGKGASIKPLVATGAAAKAVTEQVKVWTEEDHLRKANEDIRALYESLRDKIVELGSLRIEPKALYIAFKAKTNVVDVEVQKKALKLTLNVKKGKLADNLNLSSDISAKGHWGTGDYQVVLRDDENLLYVVSLIEQSLRINQ